MFIFTGVEEPSEVLSNNVHLAENGVDLSNCGNISQPCKTLKYSFLRISDGGTIYIHDSINDCGTQALTGKTLTIEAWSEESGVTFNCGIGHNFLTLQESKTTFKNVKVKGGVIFLSGTNQLNITSSSFINTVIANGGIYSNEIQIFVQTSVWQNMLHCDIDSPAMLYSSVLTNVPICDTFSRIDITPAGVNHLFILFSETSFFGTTLNIGGQLSTNINIDNTLFTNTKSGETQTRKLMNILIAKGASSVNISRSVFRDVTFEDTRGQDLFQQSALVVQEYVLTDRTQNSFVSVNLLNCTFLRNTRALTVQISSHAKVNIIDSSFAENMAQGGGGALWVTLGRINRALDIFNIDILQLFGLNNNRVTVTVSHCLFANNTAITDAILQNPGRGGAIFSDATVELTVFACTFTNNSARLLGGSIYTGPQGSVVLSNSRFTSSDNSEHALLGHILYIQGFVYISNITLVAAVTTTDIPLLSYLGNAKLGNSFALIKSMNFSCPASHSVKLENASHPFVYYGFEHLHYSCVSCPYGTYSTEKGEYWTEAEVSNVEFGHRSIINSTTVTNRQTSLTHVECKACPYGGFCQHGLKSRRNFWGYQQMNEVQFRECLPGHGCNKDYCEKYEDCHPYRKGILCTECKEGYSETFWGTACVLDKYCKNKWIWGLVALYGVLYVLFLLFENEWKSLWHSQVRWFHRHITGTCLKNTATTNQEHKERGLLRIFIYYVQIGVLLQLDILYENEDSIVNQRKSFQESVSEIVNFNIAPIHRNLCVMVGWDKVARLAYRGIFVLYLYASLMAIYPLWVLLSRLHLYLKRSGTDNLSKLRQIVNIRFLVVFVELLLFTYQTVTDISLLSIDCVQIGTEEVLSIKGSVTCFQPWQYGMITIITLYVAPLFLVLLLGPPALSSGKLPWPIFIVGCIFPIVFVIIYPVLLIKNKSNAKKASAPDPQSTAIMVADKITGPYRNVHGIWCWEGVVILQRFVLGIIVSASNDMLVKYFLLALANLIILLLHVIVRPFKEKSSNIADITTLLFLSIISLISLVKSVLYKVGVIPVGQLQSIYITLEYINFILLIVLPFVLIVLVILACLTHIFLRVVTYLRRRYNAKTKDKPVQELSGGLGNSSKNTAENDYENDDTTERNGYTKVSTEETNSHRNTTNV